MESAKLQGDETIETPIGHIKLVDSYFGDDASRRLFNEMDYQRAAQAYVWSTPLVSIATWRDNQGKAYGVTSDTDFVVLDSLKEKRGIVTANLTTPYIFNFINLKSGAVEIEYPAGRTAGGVLDFWQRPVFDLGQEIGYADDPWNSSLVICAMSRDGTDFVFMPLGHLADGNPFDAYVPPSATLPDKPASWSLRRDLPGRGAWNEPDADLCQPVEAAV